jgi:hypothetical protein
MLTKTHPLQSEFDEEMHKMQHSHAHDMCGIIAHTKDRLVKSCLQSQRITSNHSSRGIADIALRCLVIAAECLQTREAQEEVLGIFDNLTKVTGSNAESTKNDLKQMWSWADAHPHTVNPAQMHNHFYELDPALTMSDTNGLPASSNNPLLATGDFSMENHPYQGFYVPPHHHHALDQYHYGAYLI